MNTVLLTPGVNPIAISKYIIINSVRVRKIISYCHSWRYSTYIHYIVTSQLYSVEETTQPAGLI
jgi:hypothetical protein